MRLTTLALIEDQADRQRDRDQHHQPAPPAAVIDRLRDEQPLHRLDHQEQRRGGDEGALRQARQRLGLAMAEAMLLVGGGQRLVDGEQIECRR